MSGSVVGFRLTALALLMLVVLCALAPRRYIVGALALLTVALLVLLAAQPDLVPNALVLVLTFAFILLAGVA